MSTTWPAVSTNPCGSRCSPPSTTVAGCSSRRSSAPPRCRTRTRARCPSGTPTARTTSRPGPDAVVVTLPAPTLREITLVDVHLPERPTPPGCARRSTAPAPGPVRPGPPTRSWCSCTTGVLRTRRCSSCCTPSGSAARSGCWPAPTAPVGGRRGGRRVRPGPERAAGLRGGGVGRARGRGGRGPARRRGAPVAAGLGGGHGGRPRGAGRRRDLGTTRGRGRAARPARPARRPPGAAARAVGRRGDPRRARGRAGGAQRPCGAAAADRGRIVRRADALRTRSVLAGLDALLRTAPPASDGGKRLRYQLERVRAGAHELREIELLDLLRSGDLPLPDDELRVAERLLGADGGDVAARLGLRRRRDRRAAAGRGGPAAGAVAGAGGTPGDVDAACGTRRRCWCGRASSWRRGGRRACGAALSSGYSQFGHGSAGCRGIGGRAMVSRHARVADGGRGGGGRAGRGVRRRVTGGRPVPVVGGPGLRGGLGRGTGRHGGRDAVRRTVARGGCGRAAGTGGDAFTYNPALAPEGADMKVYATSDGTSTTVRLEVDGLLPDRGYAAHAHANACGPTGDAAGPHFQNRPTRPRRPASRRRTRPTPTRRTRSGSTCAPTATATARRPPGAVRLHRPRPGVGDRARGETTATDAGAGRVGAAPGWRASRCRSRRADRLRRSGASPRPSRQAMCWHLDRASCCVWARRLSAAVRWSGRGAGRRRVRRRPRSARPAAR